MHTAAQRLGRIPAAPTAAPCEQGTKALQEEGEQRAEQLRVPAGPATPALLRALQTPVGAVSRARPAPSCSSASLFLPMDFLFWGELYLLLTSSGASLQSAESLGARCTSRCPRAAAARLCFVGRRGGWMDGVGAREGALLSGWGCSSSWCAICEVVQGGGRGEVMLQPRKSSPRRAKGEMQMLSPDARCSPPGPLHGSAHRVPSFSPQL